MCGIAGVMTADGRQPDQAVLQRMSDALGHRGPDGRGRHSAGSVGLIQTRLAIIDLETGDQPLYAEMPDGRRVALVANGEVYNYRELAEDLPRRCLATRSDCEPPLHLYLRQGLDFVHALRGMYAIAIHHPGGGADGGDRLVLVRDPFGIKPLYYVANDDGFAFASEPRSLFAAGLVTPRLREEGRAELLQFQFTTGRETAFEGIHRVLPGETLVVERGAVVEWHRRDALPADGPRSLKSADALHQLDELLNETVGLHQRSDVPYGMFLSGGVDSSVVLAMMARLNPQPVRAFTAGFSGTGVHDEREHARAVAEAVGADHEEVEFGEDDFWQLLPEIAEAMDDPAADYAVLPTYKLAAAVRAAGLKVVLSGEGGDELFGGYGRYRRAARWRLFGGRPMRQAGAFDGLDLLRENPAAWRAGLDAAEAAEHKDGRTALQTAQAVDCADWLPNDLLTKLDRCLMAHGVEGRVPFVDPVMADFAFRLPDRLKIRRNRGKWLLRKWLETGLPSAKPFSAKRGFTVPVGEWIATRASRLGPLVAAQPGIDEICRPGVVEAVFKGTGKRPARVAWMLLFYALWHRRHILGLSPQGDVFESLATAA